MTLLGRASALLLALLSGCVYLPLVEQLATSALPPPQDSAIGRTLARDPLATPRAVLVQDADEALATRIHMIEAAETSLDLQYFIWQNDYTGILVIEKLLQAADRGVRVRALIDDVRLVGLVDRISALNRHPNIEIRIFNPFNIRVRFPFAVFQLAEFALDGNRLNHRMHNKLAVADNQLALLGGRNIGDDYFGQSREWYFFDTDILLSGPLVSELSAGFDVYWNSRWSYPVSALAEVSLAHYDLEELRTTIHERLARRPRLAALVESLEFNTTLERLARGATIAEYRALVDDPEVSWFDRPDELAEELTGLAVGIEREVVIVTPYVVPTANLLDIAEELVDRGVRISILTNSLATNNHPSAHAAYTRFRDRMLDLGVTLYEFRQDAALIPPHVTAAATMHSKYILFDEDLVFIGSMNLDPRSLYLNTELGVVLRSAELSGALRESYLEFTRPANSYQVTRTGDSTRWQAGETVETREPAKSGGQRLLFRLLRLLPISSQL